MTNRWVLALAAVIGFGGQAARPQPEPVAKQIAAIEKRLEALEARALAAPTGVESRLERMENRLLRLEERAVQYRSGDSPPGFVSLVESRLGALEREVARLRR